MRTAALIQARMGSSRLPGKVLMDIGGQPMLERVVRRIKRSNLIVDTVVLTTNDALDHAIVDHCLATGTAVFQGSEADVLDRYYMAAKEFEVDVIVRITADCPFIDPGVVDEVIETFCTTQADYVSNTLERTFPHGLDVEVFSYTILSEAAEKAEEYYQREHVTPYIYEQPGFFRLHNVLASADYAHYRLTVDQVEDLEFSRALYERLGNRDTFSWKDAISILESEPDLITINRGVRQKDLFEE